MGYNSLKPVFVSLSKLSFNCMPKTFIYSVFLRKTEVEVNDKEIRTENNMTYKPTRDRNIEIQILGMTFIPYQFFTIAILLWALFAGIATGVEAGNIESGQV